MAFAPLILGAVAGGGSAALGLGATAATAIGLATMATIGQGVSAYQHGKAQQAALNAEAEARQRANSLNENLQYKRVQRLMAQQRVASAASGLQLAGSPFEVMVDTAHQYELDKSIRQYNTDIDSISLRNKGELAAMYGRSSMINSFIQAGANNLLSAESMRK